MIKNKGNKIKRLNISLKKRDLNYTAIENNDGTITLINTNNTEDREYFKDIKEIIKRHNIEELKTYKMKTENKKNTYELSLTKAEAIETIATLTQLKKVLTAENIYRIIKRDHIKRAEIIREVVENYTNIKQNNKDLLYINKINTTALITKIKEILKSRDIVDITTMINIILIENKQDEIIKKEENYKYAAEIYRQRLNTTFRDTITNKLKGVGVEMTDEKGDLYYQREGE